MDGYKLPGGSIHVSYGEAADLSTKWVTPNHFALKVRPVAQCKCGCGRDVAVGLARSLNKYDTCCKRCAKSGGTGGHDDTCGQIVDGRKATAVDAAASLADVRRWLEGVVESSASASKFADEIFDSICPDKSAYLTEDELLAVWQGMFAKLGIRTKEGVQRVEQRVYEGGVDPKQVDKSAFQKLCETTLKQQLLLKFPECLPTNASCFVKRNLRPVRKVYDFGKKLGEGSFGTVYSVTHKVSGQVRVCKRIAKDKGSGMSMEEIMNEIQNMAMLDHPNLIKVYEYFEEAGEVVQILEPCSGGELQGRIDNVFMRKGEPYTEEFVCYVMRQTLRALGFMHRERYLHKDLKPQNIMMLDGQTSLIKVIDFGLAELFDRDQQSAREDGGTLLYMAPEVFQKATTFKSDIWSAGVILYNLLTGTFPFLAQWPVPPGKDQAWWEAETEKLIKDPVRIHADPAQTIKHSRECQHLLKLMLTKDPKHRPTAEACLQHNWFKSFGTEPPPLSQGLAQNLEGYAAQPELKKAFFHLIAQQTQVPATLELHSLFTHFDVSNRGALDVTVLRQVLSRTGLPPITTQSIVHSLDKDQSGTVTWTEFLAAAMCASVCRRKELVLMAFDMIDQDKDGKIGEGDLLELFAKEGRICARLGCDRVLQGAGEYCSKVCRRSDKPERAAPVGPEARRVMQWHREAAEARRSEQKEAWERALPDQLRRLANSIARKETTPPSAVASAEFLPRQRCAHRRADRKETTVTLNKDDFAAYVGQIIEMSPGDALSAAL
jgi:calcium-dependent protein kinase